MIKAMGLNTLSVYIMWNYHEVQRGLFDFYTENKNLPLFLDLAQKHQMMVLFRPGPYVCAEWDFGGMPARLLSIDGLVIRANNPQFLK
jgi:beta-galactosidase